MVEGGIQTNNFFNKGKDLHVIGKTCKMFKNANRV